MQYVYVYDLIRKRAGSCDLNIIVIWFFMEIMDNNYLMSAFFQTYLGALLTAHFVPSVQSRRISCLYPVLLFVAFVL